MRSFARWTPSSIVRSPSSCSLPIRLSIPKSSPGFTRKGVRRRGWITRISPGSIRSGSTALSTSSPSSSSKARQSGQRTETAGALPVSEAVHIGLEIAQALVHASERGVVHRDIKPSNIIITSRGRAKLVDMGLARRFERGGDNGLTQSGMTLGTFDYISPEQARDPRDVDVRSDLYSLGCTLFQMLTGAPPSPVGPSSRNSSSTRKNLRPTFERSIPRFPSSWQPRSPSSWPRIAIAVIRHPNIWFATFSASPARSDWHRRLPLSLSGRLKGLVLSGSATSSGWFRSARLSRSCSAWPGGVETSPGLRRPPRDNPIPLPRAAQATWRMFRAPHHPVRRRGCPKVLRAASRRARLRYTLATSLSAPTRTCWKSSRLPLADQ